RQSPRSRIPEVVLTQEVLHLWRGLGIDYVPAPHFGLMRPAWMPDSDSARLAWMQGRIRENFPRTRSHPPPLTPAAPPRLFPLPEVLGHHWRVLVRGGCRPILR